MHVVFMPLLLMRSPLISDKIRELSLGTATCLCLLVVGCVAVLFK
jgi:hypothetical protein